MTNEELLSLTLKAINEHSSDLREYLEQGLDANTHFEEKSLLSWVVTTESYDGWFSTKESIAKETGMILKQVETLIAFGADLNWVNAEGDTLLHLAKVYKVVKLLLSKGMDLNKTNSMGVPAHNNDRFDGKRRMLAFFEAGADLSYLALSDNPCLNHPEIMLSLLKSGKIYTQKQLCSALDRALELSRWLPSAKVLLENGANMHDREHSCNGLTPLERCINSTEIYGQWYTMRDYKNDGFKALDEKIQNHPYFKFAQYLYEAGAFNDITPYFIKIAVTKPSFDLTVFMPPLSRIAKDHNYLPSKRVIHHLAKYEAEKLGVDVTLYEETIYKIISPPVCTSEAVYDCVHYDRGPEMVGSRSVYNHEIIQQILNDLKSPVLDKAMGKTAPLKPKNSLSSGFFSGNTLGLRGLKELTEKLKTHELFQSCNDSFSVCFNDKHRMLTLEFDSDVTNEQIAVIAKELNKDKISCYQGLSPKDTIFLKTSNAELLDAWITSKMAQGQAPSMEVKK